MNILLKTMIVGCMATVALPAMAVINVTLVADEANKMGNQMVEKMETELTEQYEKISQNISAPLLTTKEISFDTALDVAESGDFTSIVSSPAADNIQSQVANVQSTARQKGANMVSSAAKGVVRPITDSMFDALGDALSSSTDWIKTQLTPDTSSPEAEAATALNQKNQVFVSSAQGYALSQESQKAGEKTSSSVIGALRKITGENDFASMYKQLANMQNQITQKVQASAMIQAQLLEISSSSALMDPERNAIANTVSTATSAEGEQS